MTKRKSRPVDRGRWAGIEQQILDALVDDCIRQVDTDGDGVLSFGEFFAWAGTDKLLDDMMYQLQTHRRTSFG